MGRPLNKKYFGNRNIGSASTTADNGLGGKRIASVTIDTPGIYTTRATATFALPDLTGVGAVRATGTVTMEALAVTVNAGGTDYDVGDLVAVTGAGGLVARVASVDDDPTNGVVLTLDFTGPGTSRGEQTVLTGLTTGVATTKVTGEGNDDLTVDVTYRVKAVVITEAGSGYTDAADAAITFSNGVAGVADRAAGTVVMATDTGAVGTTTNQENAITMTAFLTGGSAVTVDIIRQVSTRRYKVTDGTRTGIVTLQDSLANAAGECSIVATDASNGTYYVTKLTAHKATLKRGTGTVYTDGAAVPWTFGDATATVCKIANS